MIGFGHEADVEAGICLDQHGLSQVATLAPEWLGKVQAFNREVELASLSLLAAGPSSVLLFWHKSYCISHMLN